MMMTKTHSRKFPRPVARFVQLQGGRVGLTINAGRRSTFRHQKGSKDEARGQPVKGLGDGSVADFCTKQGHDGGSGKLVDSVVTPATVGPYAR